MSEWQLEYIGGIAVNDCEQYWKCLGRKLRDYFPMNGVPNSLSTRYIALEIEIEELLVKKQAFVKFVEEEFERLDGLT